jgi:hypothetical protein
MWRKRDRIVDEYLPLNDTYCHIDRYRKTTVLNSGDKLMVKIHLIQ